MIDRSKKLPAFFYENARRRQPVREWIPGAFFGGQGKRWARHFLCGAGAHGATAWLHQENAEDPPHDLKLALKRMKEVS